MAINYTGDLKRKPVVGTVEQHGYRGRGPYCEHFVLIPVLDEHRTRFPAHKWVCVPGNPSGHAVQEQENRPGLIGDQRYSTKRGASQG